MKQMTFALALLCLATLAVGSARAETYVVGVENIEYYPHYTVKSGEYGGFARALLEAFAEAQGHTFEYRAMPVARLFQSFVEGRVDLKYPDNEYWSSDLKKGRTVVYSQPVVAYIDGVSVLPEKIGKSVDDIKVLGTVRGFTAWDWMDRIEAGQVKLSENSNFKALVKQTLGSRVDGAYANVAVVQHVLEREMNMGGALVFDASLPHTKSNYHLSSIKHPQLIRAFDQWMAANTDVVDALKERYGVTVVE